MPPSDNGSRKTITSDFGEFMDLFNALIKSSKTIERKKKIDIPDLPSDSTASEKRRALKTVLENMADTDPSGAMSESEAANLASFFEKLYEPVGETSFRHMYSEVCEVMYGFLSDGSEKADDGVPYKAVQMANSVGIVATVLENRSPAGKACSGTRKLLDHINLELTRMRYMAKQNAALTGAIERTQNLSEEYGAKIIEIGSETEEKLKAVQKEYVAILGIFAAIIIAFTSGTTFSASVLQNIDKASIYRLAFVVLSIGLFLFLMVSSLYVFLNRITGISNKGMWIMVGCGSGAFVASMIAVAVARSMGVV